jgi:hypothetical protein
VAFARYINAPCSLENHSIENHKIMIDYIHKQLGAQNAMQKLGQRKERKN